MTEHRRAWLIAAAVMAALAQPASADEYDTLRARWASKLTGGSAVDIGDPDIARAIATTAGAAQRHWDQLDKSPHRQQLWPDLANWNASATVTGSYVRLYTLAAAYASPGSPLHGKPALAADIVAALDWLNAHHYNAASAQYDNWWDWHIGTPQALTNVMTLMYGQLSATQVAAYLAAIDRYIPDPALRLQVMGKVMGKVTGKGQDWPETGANLLDKSLAVILRGVLGKSAAKITQGRDAISPGLLYVTSGDGFYVDGSFVQHSYVPYTGGYGPVLIDDMSKLLYLLNGSSWAFTDPNVGNVYAWALHSFRPLIYDGAMMDAVRGRGISRQFASDHINGRNVAMALVRLTQAGAATHPAESAALNAILKGWITRDTSFGANYYAPTPTAISGVDNPMPVYEMALLKKLQADSRVAPAAEPVEARVFASMDRAVQRSQDGGFGASLSLFSQRLSAFEYGNGENLKGWWTGMGMLNLYNADITQYNGNYWPTVDSLRLPGTTTDRSGSGTPVAWKNYPNTQTWVGGAQLDARYAALGMAFATAGVTGSTLTGKKAWFLFGDKIVAVGSGIASSDGVEIETMVENRKLNAQGSNVLTVNGKPQPSTPGATTPLQGVRWAHLAGSVAGADIAWYFPDAPAVAALREARSGSWNQLNKDGSATVYSNHFLSLALSHGSNPTAGTYSYVILPKRSVAQAADYAATPTVTVLERSAAVIAVRDRALGLVGADFWEDAPTTVSLDGKAYLSSDRKAAVLTQETDGVLKVAVADPTQRHSGAIQIEIARRGAALISASSGVTVARLSPTIQLSIGVNAAAGASHVASIQLAPSK